MQTPEYNIKHTQSSATPLLSPNTLTQTQAPIPSHRLLLLHPPGCSTSRRPGHQHAAAAVCSLRSGHLLLTLLLLDRGRSHRLRRRRRRRLHRRRRRRGRCCGGLRRLLGLLLLRGRLCDLGFALLRLLQRNHMQSTVHDLSSICAGVSKAVTARYKPDTPACLTTYLHSSRAHHMHGRGRRRGRRRGCGYRRLILFLLLLLLVLLLCTGRRSAVSGHAAQHDAQPCALTLACAWLHTCTLLQRMFGTAHCCILIITVHASLAVNLLSAPF